MVYDSQTTSSTFNFSGIATILSSGGPDHLSSPNYETSHLAVIKASYQNKFPSCYRSIDLSAAPLRKSSIRNYRVKWARLCSFLKDCNISSCDLKLQNIMEFFSKHIL